MNQIAPRIFRTAEDFPNFSPENREKNYERKCAHEKPPESCEVSPEWSPAGCARPKTDAPSSKNVRSNGRADSRPDQRDIRSDDRRLDSGGRIAEQDR